MIGYGYQSKIPNSKCGGMHEMDRGILDTLGYSSEQRKWFKDWFSYCNLYYFL